MNRRRVPFLMFAVLCAASLKAFEWPIKDGVPLRLFGQKAPSRIERGLVLQTKDTIRSSGSGTLLITLEGSRDMTGFPGTLGNAVIVSHDDGLVTVYGNLSSTDRAKDATLIESGTIVSDPGSSGWIEEGHVSFQVFDQIKKNALNPLLLLPGLTDRKPPVIKGLMAVSASNQQSALGSVKYLRQGRYRFYADIADSVDGSPHELSPFRVSVSVNGAESAVVPFDLIHSELGRNYLGKSLFTNDRLYGYGGRMYLGDIQLNRGKNDISLSARDAAGNERVAHYTVQVD